MRSIMVVVAVIVCSVFLYDRVFVPLAASADTAGSSGRIQHPTSREETRLERLQHLQVTTDLLLVEYKQLEALQHDREKLQFTLTIQMFGESLDKESRATWQRWSQSPQAVYEEWKNHLPADKRDALIAEDDKRKEVVNQKEEEYRKAIEDHRGEVAKAFYKKLDEFPISKQYWEQKAFVDLLERERLTARQALMKE